MPTPIFILVRPQHPGNIGAAARAIGNFGAGELRLVAPHVPPTHPDAVARAVSGRAILQRAGVFDNLTDALHGCRLVLGTTRRKGQHRQLTALPELQNLLTEVGPRTRVAIVFGSEEWGLTNDELQRCHALLTIPTDAARESLNLAHAVAVVAYEWRRAVVGRRSPVAGKVKCASRAIATSVEAMYVHLQSALDAIGFFPHGDPVHVMRNVRQLFNRAELTADDVKFLRGLARQMMWAGKQ